MKIAPAVLASREARAPSSLARLALAGLLLSSGALAGCSAAPESPVWLERVELAAEVRQGSPLLAVGRGLRGQTMRLSGPEGGVDVALGSRPDPGIMPAVVAQIVGAWTHGAVSSAPLPNNAILDRACLVGAAGRVAPSSRCVAIGPCRWRTDVMTGDPPQLVLGDPPTLTLGSLVAVRGGGIPLPGEGTATADIELRWHAAGDSPVPPDTPDEGDTAYIEGVGLWPWRAEGSPGAYLLVAPRWLGGRIGSLALRMRLRRVVPAGAHTTAWGPWTEAVVAFPPLAGGRGRAAEVSAWGRGEPLPDTEVGVRWPAIWRGGPAFDLRGMRLLVSGTWHTAAGAAAGSWPAVGADARSVAIAGTRRPRAVLDSSSWFTGGWQGHVGERFVGSVAWQLSSPQHTAHTGAAMAVSAQLKPTVQAIVIEPSASTDAGFARYGLLAWRDWLLTRVRALVRAHFSPWSVDVRMGGLDPAFAEGRERVRVALLDRDPNGFGLLGNDPSAGKDVGNQRLDERLDGGVDLTGRGAGQPPYGGVFLAGFLLFSPQLNPGGGVADPAFDALFAAFAPALGGRAARAAPGTTPSGAVAAALEALAQLVAGTVSHEVGHTLGLANAPGYHHSGDNPGWRMDAGTARPFAERAALPGSGGERWGPLDAAYLDMILPRAAP